MEHGTSMDTMVNHEKITLKCGNMVYFLIYDLSG